MMTLDEALAILATHRQDHLVISTMAAVGAWPRFSDTPRDFAYMPSSMGQAPALALGLALAHPHEGIVVLNGDGSMLMNLGSLVTLAQYPSNIFLIVLDNGLYEVTGGQPTVGAGRVDFVGLAKAAGFSRTYQCSDQRSWSLVAAEALTSPGPVFICLQIEPRFGQKTPRPPRSMDEQLKRLQSVLRKDS